jgi:glycosyltransferase involved in cell wall biosynthesis
VKARLLVICPKYPPIKDGLSGHTYQLCKELSKECTVDLLTSINTPSEKEESIIIHPTVSKWSFTHLRQAFNKLPHDYECTIVQYVPSLYGRRGGINFSILIFFLWLRFIKKQNTSFIFHELFYPLYFNWKSITLHCIHKVMLFISILSSRQAFYSTEKYKKIGQKFSFTKKKHFHLPVGASIDIPTSSFGNTAPTNEESTYVLLGGFHPSKRYDLIFEVFSKVESHVSTKLNIVGTTKEELEKQTDLPSNFDEFALCYGKLEDEEVVSIFHRSSYLIAYFSDGMSTRRSSAISALANGLPIISTKTAGTDSIFSDNKSIILFDVEEENFKTSLTSFINSPEQSASCDASSFYKEHFSWEKVSKTLISRSLSSF